MTELQLFQNEWHTRKELKAKGWRELEESYVCKYGKDCKTPFIMWINPNGVRTPMALKWIDTKLHFRNHLKDCPYADIARVPRNKRNRVTSLAAVKEEEKVKSDPPKLKMGFTKDLKQVRAALDIAEVVFLL